MSFGGGSQNLGFDVIVGAQGAGLVNDLITEIERLKTNLEGVQNMYADGSINVQQYVGQTRNLEKQLKGLQATLDQARAAIDASNAAVANSGQGFAAWSSVVKSAAQTGKEYADQLDGMAQLQAHLGQMEQQAAKDAAESQALLGNATKTATVQVHDQAGEIEKAAAAKRRATRDAETLARVERGLADAFDQMAHHEATATRAIDTTTVAHGKAAQASGKSRQGLIQFAYAIDDAQYGMRGLGNNLIQVAAQMGGVWGGAVTVAIASATVLYSQWNHIAALLGESIRTTTNDIDALKRHIKTLEEKPTRFALDLTELDRARQKLDDLETKRQAFESASKAMTDTQGKVASNVHEAVVEHAGGTDIESGAANLAKAIADKRKSEGTFLTGEDKTAILNAENEAERDKKILESPSSVMDKDVYLVNLDIYKKSKQKLDQLKYDAEKRGMEAIQAGLIGGALKGIDADRQKLLDTINADPEFFKRRGIGDQFRADLIAGSAANVRGQQSQAIDQARDKRNAASDKVVADIAKAKADAEAENLNEQGRVNEQAGEQAQRDQKKAETDRQRRIDELARTNAVAVEGQDHGLTQGVNTMLGRGMTPDQIADRFAAESEHRLSQVPGMDPAMVADVAERIIRDVVEKQAPQIVAAGGGADAAAQLNAGLAGKNFDATNRIIKADRRRDLATVEADAADRFHAQGANVNQALALGHETARLVKSGLDFDQAMYRALMNLTGQTRQFQMQQTAMLHQLRRSQGMGHTFVSNLPRGRSR